MKYTHLKIEIFTFSVLANKLRSGATVEAETFSSVTLLMLKVANFGELCATSRPTAIVSIVNKMQLIQDKMMEKYDAYRV